MKFINPLTTAEPVGVATRDIVVIVGASLTVLGALGLVTEEQAKMLTDQAPVLMAAAGTLITGAMMIYRAMFKSSSDKGAEAAKQIDQKLPPAMPVEIKTPEGQSDIKINVTSDGTVKT